MALFGVVADDLTGAMDAGMQMLEKGCVRVALNLEDLKPMMDGADFIVVNTQSRNICGQEAYRKVRLATQMLIDNDIKAIYKKIDSTLRGHIGFEVKAMLDCNAFDCVIIAPALPFNNRVTIKGIHYVNGVKLFDTEFARDPFSPIRSSAIGEIIREESDIEFGLVSLDSVRKGSKAVLDEINRFVDRDVRVIIVDAVEESDLFTIAEAMRLFKGNKVLCGSAGLFKYFDVIYDIDGKKMSPEEEYPTTNGKPLLVISGSPAFMSKRQIEYAASSRRNIRIISCDVALLAQEKRGDAVIASKGVVEQAMKGIQEGYTVVIDVAGKSKESISKDCEGDKERLGFVGLFIQEFAAEVVFHVVSRGVIGGLVIFGGDTAYTAIKRLGAKGIEIVREIEPYIPCGRLMGGDFSGLPVVTKAGGFGKVDSLVNILNNFVVRGDKQ